MALVGVGSLVACVLHGAWCLTSRGRSCGFGDGFRELAVFQIKRFFDGKGFGFRNRKTVPPVRRSCFSKTGWMASLCAQVTALE